MGSFDQRGRMASTATIANGQAIGSWRGYAYDAGGRLSDLFEAEQVMPPSLDGTPIADVGAVAHGLGAVRWKYARDGSVGSTNEIAAPALPAVRWSTSLPRADGHEIRGLALNGTPLVTIDHDAHGRISALGSRRLEYDLLGRLAAVRSAQGAIIEEYLYGVGGELRVVVGPDGGPRYAFLHDRGRLVVAFDQTGKPAWDATWTPAGTDLLLWRDLRPPGRTVLPVGDLRHDIVAAWDADGAGVTSSARF
jgi:YD repeat-containing protein